MTLPRNIAVVALLLTLFGFEECDLHLGFVSIESPEPTTFTEAQTVTITATALEGEGLAVEEVRFYRNGDQLMGTDATAPYTFRWPITAAHNGTHRFHAEATYYVGPDGEETLKSDEVMYEVAIGPEPSLTGVLGSIEGFGNPYELDFDADTGVGVARDRNGLKVIDLRDPTQPRVSAHIDLDGAASRVALHNGLAYVVERLGGGSNLVTLDLNDPRNPQDLARIAVPGKAGGVGVKNGLAYVANDAGLHVVDVANAREPRLVQSAPADLTIFGDVVVGDDFIATQSSTGVAWFDARNPRKPSYVDAGDLPGGLARIDDIVYVASGSGVYMLDLSNVRAVSGHFVSRPSKIVSFIAASLDGLYLPTPAGVELFDPIRERVLAEVSLAARGRLLASGGDYVVAIDATGTLHVISMGP